MDCQVFMVTLPADCVERSKLVRRMEQIELRHVDPVDLIVSKLGRYDDRDQEDIQATVRAYKVTASQVRGRAGKATYAGNEDAFAHHLDLLVRSMG